MLIKNLYKKKLIIFTLSSAHPASSEKSEAHFLNKRKIDYPKYIFLFERPPRFMEIEKFLHFNFLLTTNGQLNLTT